MHAALFRTLNIRLRALNIRRTSEERNDEGFTLIELLIVIVIIGILAAIAIPTFLGQQNAARDGVVSSDLGAAKVAVVSHITLNNNKIDGLTEAKLTSYGFTKSTETTDFKVTGTAGAATFCIQGKSATGSYFNVTNASSTVGTGACPTGATDIVAIP